MSRTADQTRKTGETSVRVRIDLDGTGVTSISTGVGFFDHMLDQLGRHAGFDLEVVAEGDLHIDSHHTVEDAGITLGSTLTEALGAKEGIARYGWSLVPMEEALVQVALDLSGRPFISYEVEVPAEKIGNYDPDLTEEFLTALVRSAGITLHVKLLAGRNSHHIVESVFKGLARALREAVAIQGVGVPSTKGVL